MKPIRKYSVDIDGSQFKIELFAHGDATLCKLEYKYAGLNDNFTPVYGWAYRNSDDKPNRKKGMTVALTKALDACACTSKARHTILTKLSDPIIWIPASIKPTRDNKWYNKSLAVVEPLQLLLSDGRVVSGGFGVGLSWFYIRSPYEKGNWQDDFDGFEVISWRPVR